jgi:hypothetical protein
MRKHPGRCQKTAPVTRPLAEQIPAAAHLGCEQAATPGGIAWPHKKATRPLSPPPPCARMQPTDPNPTKKPSCKYQYQLLRTWGRRPCRLCDVPARCCCDTGTSTPPGVTNQRLGPLPRRTDTSCCTPGVCVPAGLCEVRAQAHRPLSHTPPPPLHAQCTDPMKNHGTMTEPHPEARLSTTGTSCCAPGVCVPAGLCKVPARCDAQLERQVLQEHCQHVADQDDKQQAVAKLGTTCQACGPVTRVPTAERPGKSRDGDAKRWQRVIDVVVLLPAGALPPETNTMALLRVSCGGPRSCGKR